MSAALAPITNRYDQADIVATIKQTVARGATDAQLRMFLEVCRSTGLDPFLKEIWYVAEKGLIMAARDGYLRVANESPEFDGLETRVERDERGIPIKAVCTVWRKDRNHPVISEAYFNEYAKQSPVWKQYPSAMISKVAEVLALKRSFAINGVVSEEELGYEGPRGSAEAAQDVARAKIEEIRRRPAQLAPVIAEEIPEPEDEDRYIPEDFSQLEQELHESILLVESLKPPKHNPSYDSMLRAFAEVKARYDHIGFLRTYYAYLGRFGVYHSNEFPRTEEGISQARCCYKEMSLDVANREVRAAR